MKILHVGAHTRFIFFAALVVALSPLLLLIALARRRSARERLARGTPRILIVPIITRVGDVVCATPVFRELKCAYPKSHLAVVAAHKVLGVLKNNPRIDHLIDWSGPSFCGFWGRGRFFASLFFGRYDAVFGLGSSPLGTIAGLAGAAPIRVKTSVPHPSLFERLTDWMNTRCLHYKPGTFLQKHYVSLLSAIGINTCNMVKEIYATAFADEKARDFIVRSFGEMPSFLAGITVSAGNKIKEWPPERFAEVADTLAERFGARTLFIDSPSNRARVEDTIRLMRTKGVAVPATNFSLEELPSLIKALSVFIAVDTGAIYIAHALGVPLVDIIGPVHPDEQPPKDSRSVQVLPQQGIIPTSFVLTPPTRGAVHTHAVLSIMPADVIAAVYELTRRGILSTVSSSYAKYP